VAVNARRQKLKTTVQIYSGRLAVYLYQNHHDGHRACLSELLVGLNHLMCVLVQEVVVVNEAYRETGQVNFIT
jgi:hypothetical protein